MRSSPTFFVQYPRYRPSHLLTEAVYLWLFKAWQQSKTSVSVRQVYLPAWKLHTKCFSSDGCIPYTLSATYYIIPNTCSCLTALGKLRRWLGVLIDCDTKQSLQQRKPASEMTLPSSGTLAENRIQSPESQEKPYLQKFIWHIMHSMPLLQTVPWMVVTDLLRQGEQNEDKLIIYDFSKNQFYYLNRFIIQTYIHRHI